MNKASVVVVILSIVALVNAQCSCQTKPPTDGKHQGEACQCGRQYPVQMEVPKITEHRDAHYDYGFTIERPQEPPAQVKYAFDFHMEKPKTLPTTASLANYEFVVDTPVQKEAAVPQRYRFDYQVQTPIAKIEPSAAQGLFAIVDKVVVQNQESNGCQCNSYKPTIDHLRRCPKHGHLYQYGGALYPNPPRYNKQEIPDQVPQTSDRPKRNVAPKFPIKIKELLPGLRPNNQIRQMVPVEPPVEDENQNRISEILKKNFGEDPTENIDELLRPKPLGSTKNVVSEVEKARVIDGRIPLTSDFIAKIKPKLEEAKSNFRDRITKIVNKARLDAIKANQLIQKRSIQSEELMDESFEGSFDPVWITEESVEETDTRKTANDPNIEPDADGVAPTNDRFRKHCDRCGELAKKFPCPSCGATPRGYPLAVSQSNPIPIQTIAPRYAYDRYGRRYIENNKSDQSADDVTVGSYHNQAAYGELQDILSKNSGAMYTQNRRVDDGHLIQPMNFEHASDAIRFVQELTQRNGPQFNEDYYTTGNSYEVGASPRNFHAKRSFKIIPIAEKDDGSIFVKISPVAKSKLKNKPKEDFTKYFEDDETKVTPKIEENIFGKEEPKANFKKVERNGKQYEILSLNADGSDKGSADSAEDLEILKYIYAVNQKEHSTDEVFDEIIDENKLANSEDTRVET